MTTPQPGDRIRLVHTDDTWTRLWPGALGTVRSVDDNHTVHTDWDDGSRLGLSAASGDRWDVVGWRVSVDDHSYHVTTGGWCGALHAWVYRQDDPRTITGEQLSGVVDGQGEVTACGRGWPITEYDGVWLHVFNPELTGSDDHEVRP